MYVELKGFGIFISNKHKYKIKWCASAGRNFPCDIKCQRQNYKQYGAQTLVLSYIIPFLFCVLIN